MPSPPTYHREPAEASLGVRGGALGHADTGEEGKEGPMELLFSQTMREKTDRQKESETEQQDRGTEVYRELSGCGPRLGLGVPPWGL